MKRKLSKNTAYTFFSGHSTPLQKKVIEEWLQEKKNLEQFFIWLEEWETEHAQFIPNTQKALQQYRSRIEKSENEFIPPSHELSEPELPKRLRSPRWWIAAAVAGMCLFAFLLTKDRLYYRTYATAYGEIKTVKLEDGSQVTLNAHSALKVPRFGFGNLSREVLLQGEAEFIVTHTVDNQFFHVRTPDRLEVEVLGTEFVVYSRGKGTKVVLSKGKVQLKSLGGTHAQALTVQPGEVVLVDTEGKFKVRYQQPTEIHTAWKEHRFVFDKTSLREAAERIDEIFGVRVTIPDTTLANRAITGTFPAESADELLLILSDLLEMDMSKSGEEIILSNKQNPL